MKSSNNQNPPNKSVRLTLGRDINMEVSLLQKSWEIQDEAQLMSVLNERDKTGGAEFWLAAKEKYPCLAMVINNSICWISFFPSEGHPGYRLIGGEGLPPNESTLFVWDGADPSDGEETPNQFVVSLSNGLQAANEFFLTEKLPTSGKWYEL